MNIQREASRDTILGLPRPLLGALIGILLFLLLVIPLKLLEHRFILLSFVLLDLELLGRLTISALSAFADIELPETVSRVLSTLLSAIPPAVLGFLIGSTRRSIRVTGIVLLAIYLCIILALGTLLTLMAI